jgi:hypothetical protein
LHSAPDNYYMPTSSGDENRSPATALWLPLAVCAAAAVCIDLGSIHRLHSADSLLYPLISLWRWTPYYWGQDRFGMLVPALAIPVKHPLANLLVQDYLNIFGGLAAFVLLARYVFRDAAYAILGTTAAALFVAFVPGDYQAMYFIDATYGIWLSLGLAGLILAAPRANGISWTRVAIGLLLIVEAHWVNYATAMVLGPLVILRSLFAARSAAGLRADAKIAVAKVLRSLVSPETAIALGLLAIGSVAGRLLTLLATSPVPTPLDALPVIEWPEAWWGLLETQWRSLQPARLPAALGLVAVAGLATLVTPSVYAHRLAPWRAASALWFAAVCIWLVTGTRLWVKQNGYTYRYLIPATIMVELAVLGWALGPICLSLGRKPRAAIVALTAGALITAALCRFGLPSLARVRADLDREFGKLTPDLIAAHCTHLAGSYDIVWPAVFHASIVLYEHGEHRVIWGLTGRLEATSSLLTDVPVNQVRMGMPIGDPGAEVRRNQLPPVVEVERRGTIRVYIPFDANPDASESLRTTR